VAAAARQLATAQLTDKMALPVAAALATQAV